MQEETQDFGILPDLTLSILWQVKSALDKGPAFTDRILFTTGTSTTTAVLLKNNPEFPRAAYFCKDVKHFRMLSHINGTSEGCVTHVSQHAKFQKLEKPKAYRKQLL